MADAALPFGIDLGTTHSVIAHLDDAGRPVVVKSEIGEDTTPSVVYFEARDRVLVGGAAKNSAVLAPHFVAQLVKRDMGKPDVSYPFHGKTYTPEAVSSLILRELIRAVEKNVQRAVREAVITVPAYFAVAERAATRRAGEIAGLTVLEVIDEPIAAALHYQALHQQAEPRCLLVCDLGGGTYDTTVILVRDKEVRVVCTDGDARLGGADWDMRVRYHLLDRFHEQQPRLDPTADETFMQDLAISAEQLKKQLSKVVTRRTDLRFAGAVARIELTRQQLEELTADPARPGGRRDRANRGTGQEQRGAGVRRGDPGRRDELCARGWCAAHRVARPGSSTARTGTRGGEGRRAVRCDPSRQDGTGNRTHRAAVRRAGGQSDADEHRAGRHNGRDHGHNRGPQGVRGDGR